MKFCGNILLTDPVYIIKNNSDDDWKRLLSEGSDHAALYLLGITNYLSGEIGEDSARDVISDNKMRIGSFCSDSALFCVCELKQVLWYNPDFLSSLEKSRECFCVINDFDGEIMSVVDEKCNSQIIGIGNNGFKTQSR